MAQDAGRSAIDGPVGTGACTVSAQTLDWSVRAIRIENEMLAATILPDKGADIYQLIYKPRALDVLWKSPWGVKGVGRSLPSASQSMPAWLDAYPGGWQLLFPSGGGPCTYKGIELNFHGEASMTAWDVAITALGHDVAEVRLTTRLSRSPFRLVRTLRVEAGRPILTIRDRIVNEGGEALDYMWGYHPALGAPFLSDECRIDIGARTLYADDAFDGPWNPLTPDARSPWPLVTRNGKATDMSRVPGRDAPRHILAYFEDFESGWYAVTNTALGFGIGVVWPAELFPYAWFWQEMHASTGYPWYKGVYTMAIEPCSSIPGQGLVAVMEKTASHRILQPGEGHEAEIRAVFYESAEGVRHIDHDGVVELREE